MPSAPEGLSKKPVAPLGLTRRERKDLLVLAKFTSVYCRVHHRQHRQPLPAGHEIAAALGLHRDGYCSECRAFLEYAFARRLRCPLDPKPACKHCPVHCYRPDYRQRVRDIMRFAGPYLMRRGRIDLLWHYFF